MPHFSFTITGFPVRPFRKGFGFRGKLWRSRPIRDKYTHIKFRHQWNKQLQFSIVIPVHVKSKPYAVTYSDLWSYNRYQVSKKRSYTFPFSLHSFPKTETIKKINREFYDYQVIISIKLQNICVAVKLDVFWMKFGATLSTDSSRKKIANKQTANKQEALKPA